MSSYFLSKRFSNAKPRPSGFSLIEVLVALSLFSFSMLAMVSMQISMQRMIHEALLQNQALNYAVTRHELFELAQSDSQASSNLLPEWHTELEKRIPFARSKTVSKGENFSISILWPASIPKSGTCNTEQKTATSVENCLQL